MAEKGKIDAHDRKVDEMLEKARGLGDGDGYEYVVRTRYKMLDTGEKAEVVEAGKSEDVIIRVGTFKTVPARIVVQKGLTCNLGNYESARVTVGLEIPCYLEEAVEEWYKATRSDLKILKGSDGVPEDVLAKVHQLLDVPIRESGDFEKEIAKKLTIDEMGKFGESIIDRCRKSFISQIEEMIESRVGREVLEIRGKDIRPGYEAKRQALMSK